MAPPIRRLLLGVSLLVGIAADIAAGSSLILATTTSTRDSGLLDALVPVFEAASGVEVKVIAVGSGAALKMAERGDADVVLAHAPASEQVLVDTGVLLEGRLVMFNDFVLLGPGADPAAVRQAGGLDPALQAVASHGSFISRGDDSGTHKMELALWAAAGVDWRSMARREESGQGMGATLRIADQKRAYTLCDRGTFLAQRRGLDLRVVFEGAPELRNIYHVHVVSPVLHPQVKAAAARAFAAFLLEPTVQARIGRFQRELYGEPLFQPAAALTGTVELAGTGELAGTVELAGTGEPVGTGELVGTGR